MSGDELDEADEAELAGGGPRLDAFDLPAEDWAAMRRHVAAALA